MSGRMSNRDRIAHAAREAEAARKERERTAAERAANPPERARARKAKPTKPAGRTRIVWVVCDASGSTVDTFPYAKEAEARALAERLTEEKGRPHFVKRAEVPLD